MGRAGFCKNGHELTPENSVYSTRFRRCKICHMSPEAKAIRATRQRLRRQNDRVGYNKRVQEWRDENRAHVKEYNRQHKVTRHHITWEEHQALLKSQGGVCAMCGGPPDKGRDFDVDHDHKCCPGTYSCGKCIRGLIHSKCNRAIGQLNDNPEMALKAYQYLNRVKESSMSSFRQQETQMNDARCLEDTLKAMGHKPVVSNEKQAVRGHYNETRKAEIILKKEDLKEGGDVGFSKDAKGNFAIVTDTYVMRNGFNLDKFSKEVKQKYAETKIRRQAAQAGLTFIRKVDNGNGGFKMQFVKA